AATSMGLALQPSFAPLWFAEFSRLAQRFPDRSSFTEDQRLRRHADWIAQALDKEKGGPTGRIVFRGRLGSARTTPLRARSVRLVVQDLAAAAQGRFGDFTSPAGGKDRSASLREDAGSKS